MTNQTRARDARIRTAMAAGVVAVTAIGLVGCSSSEDNPAASGPREFELTESTPEPVGPIDNFVWTGLEPTSVDYAYAYDYYPSPVVANVCDSLLRVNADLSVAPALAESWQQGERDVVYTLRDDVTFHDGTPMTSADVVASMQRHRDAAVGSVWAFIYKNVEGIEATGPHEVTVRFTKPDALFNSAMATQAGVVESAATLEKLGASYGTPTGLVNCSGPFELKEWTPGNRAVFTKFDQYWDPNLQPYAKQFEYRFLEDAASIQNGFVSGDIDGGWFLPSTSFDTLNASGEGEVLLGLSTQTFSAIVTNLDGGLKDPAVRQALLTAMDRKGLVAAAANGYAEVANAFVTPGGWSGVAPEVVDEVYAGLDPYDFDPEKAKTLVQGIDLSGQEIVIGTLGGDPNFAIVAQAIQSAAQTIGLKATINNLALGDYDAAFNDPAAREGLDLLLSTWSSFSGDPIEMLSQMATDSTNNFSGWSNPEYQQLVADGLATYDVEKRAEYAAKALAIFNKELPWLTLYWPPMSLWMGERITGVDPSINYLYFPWAAKIGAAQ